MRKIHPLHTYVSTVHTTHVLNVVGEMAQAEYVCSNLLRKRRRKIRASDFEIQKYAITRKSITLSIEMNHS